MLPLTIHLLEALRRAIKKAARGLSLFADAMDEAIVESRETNRKYPFAEC